MTDSEKHDIRKLAKRIETIADNVRQIHNAVGLPATLSRALDSLRYAEAMLLDTIEYE